MENIDNHSSNEKELNISSGSIPYVLPQNLTELNRLDFQHYILKSLLHGNYSAPLDPSHIHSILDVGCGTGLWCREMAQAFPQAQIIGLDIAAQLPKNVSSPPNFRFQHGNILQSLDIASDSIDYTHQRLLVGAIPSNNWLPVIHELARVTRTGGWLELVEGTDTYHNAGPHMQQILAWGKKASQQRGIDGSITTKLRPMFELAGLSAIESRVITTPLGTWGGRNSKLFAQDTHLGFQSLKPFLAHSLDLSPATIDKTLAALPNEWEEFQTSYTFVVIYARK